MTNLETILTVGVWALVAVVFCYYRSRAVRQQGEHSPEIAPTKAIPRGDALN